MIDLNNIEEIKRLDPQDTLGSTEMLAHQMEAAWAQVQEVQVPPDYKDVGNIVFCGMGASIYGALVFKALAGENNRYPTEYVSDYHLPKFVNSNTLVVLTSYSGTTEEVLSCAHEAKDMGAKMLILTKGGPLSASSKTNNIPAYIFDGTLNPAGVPRLGNGYTIIGLLGLLDKAGIFEVNKEQLMGAINRLKNDAPEIKKQAMADAVEYEGYIPVIFASEHLSGNAQILRNQFNETSKSFSSCFLIPDLNHHLMEGLAFPKHHVLKFIILNSTNFSEKITKRVQLTTDVVEKNMFEVAELNFGGENVYEDFILTLSYGSYLTLFLGLIHEQNPAVNPWVDWFKEELAK